MKYIRLICISVICLMFSVLNISAQSDSIKHYFQIKEHNSQGIVVDMTDLVEKAREVFWVWDEISVQVYGVGGSGNLDLQRTHLYTQNINENALFNNFQIDLPAGTHGTNCFEVVIKKGIAILWRQFVYTEPSSIDKSTLEILARQYAPIVLFHPEEEFYPMSLSRFFETLDNDSYVDFLFPYNVEFPEQDAPWPSASVAKSDVVTFMANNGHNLAEIVSDPTDSLYGGSIDDSSIYYSAYLDNNGITLYINYHLFFSKDYKYNDEGQGPATGSHWLDRESITISFYFMNGSWRPDKVTFAGHMPGQRLVLESAKSDYSAKFNWTGGRITLDYEDVMVFFDHPLIALAKGTHAVYPVSGDYTCNTPILTKEIPYHEAAGIPSQLPGADRNYILDNFVKFSTGDHDYSTFILPELERFSGKNHHTYALNYIDLHQTSTGASSERAILFSGFWIDGLGDSLKDDAVEHVKDTDSRLFPFTEPERELDTHSYVHNADTSGSFLDLVNSNIKALQNGLLSTLENNLKLLDSPNILREECDLKSSEDPGKIKIVFEEVPNADGYKITSLVKDLKNQEYYREVYILTDENDIYSTDDNYPDLDSFGELGDNKMYVKLLNSFIDPISKKNCVIKISAFSIISNPQGGKWSEIGLIKDAEDRDYIEQHPENWDTEKAEIWDSLDPINGNVVCGEEAEIVFRIPIFIPFHLDATCDRILATDNYQVYFYLENSEDPNGSWFDEHILFHTQVSDEPPYNWLIINPIQFDSCLQEFENADVDFQDQIKNEWQENSFYNRTEQRYADNWAIQQNSMFIFQSDKEVNGFDAYCYWANRAKVDGDTYDVQFDYTNEGDVYTITVTSTTDSVLFDNENLDPAVFTISLQSEIIPQFKLIDLYFPEDPVYLDENNTHAEFHHVDNEHGEGSEGYRYIVRVLFP